MFCNLNKLLANFCLVISVAVIALVFVISGCVSKTNYSGNRKLGGTNLKLIDAGIFNGNEFISSTDRIPNIKDTEFGFIYSSATTGLVRVYTVDQVGKNESNDITLSDNGKEKVFFVKNHVAASSPDGNYTLTLAGVDNSIISKTFKIGNVAKTDVASLDKEQGLPFEFHENNMATERIKPNLNIDRELVNRCSQKNFTIFSKEYMLSQKEQLEYKNACAMLLNGKLKQNDFELFELNFRLAAKKRKERQSMTPDQRQRAEMDDNSRQNIDKMFASSFQENFGDISEQYFGTRSVFDTGDGKSIETPSSSKKFIYFPKIGVGSQMWYSWKGKLLMCSNETCFALAEKFVRTDYGELGKVVDVFAFELNNEILSNLRVGSVYVVTGKYSENVKFKNYNLCAKLTECTVEKQSSTYDFK